MTELVARFDVLGNFASIYVGKMLSCLRPRVVDKSTIHMDIVHLRKKVGLTRGMMKRGTQ